MLAFAFHLFAKYPDLKLVKIHPDGEHGKRFKIKEWLSSVGFELVEPMGSTAYGGTYRSAGDKTIVVRPISGCGDVEAEVGDLKIVAECKGGVINSRHAGQLSRLRKGLCEAVGLSMATNSSDNLTQYAVVPATRVTETLANKMVDRVRRAGIRIALVASNGTIREIA
ncbi:MAG: hypothetical protein LCH62_07370 [Proteobacteria bacterium]|nr:hypothetical protein [Pseudomonadota bacterium]